MIKIFTQFKTGKITLLILLSLNLPLAIADDYTLSVQNKKANEVHVVAQSITVEDLVLNQKVSLEEFISLNPTLNEKTVLKTGTIVNLPTTKVTDNKKTVSQELTTTLPALGGSEPNNEQNELVEQLLSMTPGKKFFIGTEEENLANVAVAVGNEEWKNFNRKQIVEDIKNQGISKVKGEINQQLNQTVSDFLGRFGKAQVSLSVDEKGKLNRPELRLFSPLMDKDESLIFSEVGIHEQGSGHDKRTIGNFGLGYRYETKDYLAGVNAFIDHDFHGSNTRLGLGGEYWRDELKLAVNTYTPLTGWKESDVMKHHEKLIYEERAASGFDIRAKTYLPNYPQLGGGITFEQYFGNEVALFGTKERQKDPYALGLNIDYMPVPLLKAGVNHRIGKEGKSDTQFDLTLQMQLGTSIEEQLNPDNVALARSLKGSRYDMVDRNNDIVFEYKKENFSIEIFGPEEAVTASPVTITSKAVSKSPIVKYEWMLTKRNGAAIESLMAKSGSQNTPTLNFLMGNEDVVVRVKVTTERGYEAISNAVIIRNKMSENQAELNVIKGEAEAIDFSDYPIDTVNYLDAIENIPDTYKVTMKYTAKDEAGNPVDISDTASLEFLWKGMNDSEYQKAKNSDLVRFFAKRSADKNNEVIIYAIADKKYINGGNEGLGGKRYVNFAVVSAVGLNIQRQAELVFTLEDDNLTKLGIDPLNLLIEVRDLKEAKTVFDGPGKIVSRSGLSDGAPRMDVMNNNISANSAYEVKIYTYPDARNVNHLIDVTEYYYDSIVWLYWDEINKEISARKDRHIVDVNGVKRTYRGLEGCRGSPIFYTQVNNYEFNELAFGEILGLDNSLVSNPIDKVLNEQGLRLAVQFDITAAKEKSSNEMKICERTVKAELGYEGYLTPTSTEYKAVQWNEAE